MLEQKKRKAFRFILFDLIWSREPDYLTGSGQNVPVPAGSRLRNTAHTSPTVILTRLITSALMATRSGIQPVRA